MSYDCCPITLVALVFGAEHCIWQKAMEVLAAYTLRRIDTGYLMHFHELPQICLGIILIEPMLTFTWSRNQQNFL